MPTENLLGLNSILRWYKIILEVVLYFDIFIKFYRYNLTKFLTFYSTHNPKFPTQKSQPETRNLQLPTPNLQPETRNPHPTTQISQPTTLNPKLETLNPKTETHNSQPETRNPKPETHNSQPKTRNPQPTTRNYQPKTSPTHNLKRTNSQPFPIFATLRNVIKK